MPFQHNISVGPLCFQDHLKHFLTSSPRNEKGLALLTLDLECSDQVMAKSQQPFSDQKVEVALLACWLISINNL